MATSNSLIAKIIPTLEITTIHINNEPSIHVEHLFDTQELKIVGLKLKQTLLFCGAEHFLNELQTICLELIRILWKNNEFVNKKTIAYKFLEVKVVLSNNIIAKATWCLHEASTY